MPPKVIYYIKKWYCSFVVVYPMHSSAPLLYWKRWKIGCSTFFFNGKDYIKIKASTQLEQIQKSKQRKLKDSENNYIGSTIPLIILEVLSKYSPKQIHLIHLLLLISRKFMMSIFIGSMYNKSHMSRQCQALSVLRYNTYVNK